LASERRLGILATSVVISVILTLGVNPLLGADPHAVIEGSVGASLESLEGQDPTTGPSKNGEEGKKNCTDDVGTGEREHDVIRLAPGNTHVNEGDEIKESPKTTEGHVENDEMLPSLDGGHLFKKPFPN